MPEATEDVGRRVGRNALYLLGGEAVTKVLAAAYQVLLARYLGARLFGGFSFALALTAILGMASDLGLTTLVGREVARKSSAIRDVLVRALWGRGALAVLLGGLGVLLAAGTGRPREVVELVAILAVTQLIQGWAELAAAAHRGLERMLLPAATGAVCRLGLVLSGAVAIALSAPVQAFAALAALWTVPAAATLLRTLPGRGGLSPPPARDVAATLRAALPIGLGVVLWTFYFRVDLLLLAWIRGEAVAGLFAAPFRVTEAALLLSGPVLAAVFPVLARTDPREEQSRAAFRQVVRVLAVVGAPIAAVLAVERVAVVSTLFGHGFEGSADALLLLAPTVPVSFAAAPFLALLLSRDRDRSYAFLMAAGAVAGPALALALIPPWGATGAAAATLATECVVLLLAWRTAGRQLDLPRTWPVVARALAAGALLAGALLLAMRSGLSAPVRIALGIGIGYPILALALRAVRWRDVRLVLSALGAVKKR